VRRNDAAQRTIGDDIRRIGEEVRRARVTHGLSQSAVAHAARCSQSAVHRVERATFQGPLGTWARICRAVGLDLRASVFPTGGAARDTAHLTLLEDLRARVAPTVGWQTEVPLPRPGDPRSWDALLRVEQGRIGLDAETRPTDAQEVTRRTMAKKRDGGVDCVILLLRDTRYVRRLLREHGALIGTSFSLDSDAALDALASGRMPPGDSIILLPSRRAATMHERPGQDERAVPAGRDRPAMLART
jgi:transcriptional regulator with XRE-family HTH domain